MNKDLIEVLAHFIGPLDQGAGRASHGSPLSSNRTTSTVVASDQPKTVTHQLARQGYTRTRRFLVLPSPSEPRWLLPVGDARGMREGFRVYTPYAPVARMLKNLAVAFIGAGWTGRQRSRVLVASKGPLPLEVLVTKVTGERQPIFALSLGTPGRLRKLTVQVMRPDGEILGYIKLPLTEAATERVRHEAHVLEQLWSFPPLRQHLPKVLHAGEWENGYILFQTGGPFGPGEVELGPAHERFLQTLWGIKQVEKPGDALVEEIGADWRTTTPRLDKQWQSLGEEALRRARQRLAGLTVPCGIMHGDFAPWNTRRDNGPLFVYDWESTDWEAPIWWDVFHFHLQVEILLNKKGKKPLLFNQDPGERAVFWLYLLRSVCQGFKEQAPGQFGIEYRQQILLRELTQG